MIERVIAAIRSEQARVAHEAVARGAREGEDPAYRLGYASGMYGGLERAMAAIEKILKEDEQR